MNAEVKPVSKVVLVLMYVNVVIMSARAVSMARRIVAAHRGARL